MKKTKLMALAVVSITTLAIMTGCQSKGDNGSTTKPSTTISSTTKESRSAEATPNAFPSLAVSLADAISLYQETYPDSDITSIDLDSSLQNWYYSIEGVNDTTEFELRIDATTKDIDNKKEEQLDKEDSNGLKRQKDKLDLTKLATLEEISAIAQEQMPTGEVTDWELDKELDTTYWNVTIKDGTNEMEVKINAQTKEVIETELDD